MQFQLLKVGTQEKLLLRIQLRKHEQLINKGKSSFTKCGLRAKVRSCKISKNV